jgi:hypothetical protein
MVRHIREGRAYAIWAINKCPKKKSEIFYHSTQHNTGDFLSTLLNSSSENIKNMTWYSTRYDKIDTWYWYDILQENDMIFFEYVIASH